MNSRKNFLTKSLTLFTGVFASSIESKIPSGIMHSKTSVFPPGAVNNYTDICTGCGDCMPVCPVNAITMEKNRHSGKIAAVLKPWEKACVLCEELHCIEACEENALKFNNENNYKLGSAFILEDLCLAFNNSYCSTCYDVCPLKRSAIKIKNLKPVIDDEFCTGCGICVERCVVDKKAINIIPVL